MLVHRWGKKGFRLISGMIASRQLGGIRGNPIDIGFVELNCHFCSKIVGLGTHS